MLHVDWGKDVGMILGKEHVGMIWGKELLHVGMILGERYVTCRHDSGGKSCYM